MIDLGGGTSEELTQSGNQSHYIHLLSKDARGRNGAGEGGDLDNDIQREEGAQPDACG